MLVNARGCSGRLRGLAELMPYGAGAAYDTSTGRYVIVGQSGSYATPSELHEAMYAPEIASLSAQAPTSIPMIGPYATYPTAQYRTLPGGQQVLEQTYQQALREGTLEDLIHQYTAYGTERAVAPAAAAPAPTPTPAPTAPPTTQITRSYYPRVALTNLTRGGAAFQVGDEWVLQIVGGTPNKEVTCSGSQNGRPFGPTSFGRTDAAGSWQTSGRMGEGELGHWEERWAVASDQASPVLTFDVSAASAATQPTPPGAGVSVTGGGGPAGVSLTWRATGPEVTEESAEREGAGLPAAVPQELLDALARIPWYIWAAAAAAFLLLRGRR